ncbi:meiotic recombination, partial [Coemansia thaxteri]
DGGMRHVNYEDPHVNVALPVFSIHGNHDDPSGDGNLSAMDVLAASGLVNYFGRQAEVERVRVSPLLLRKGDTRLALYGLGNIRDERLHRTMARRRLVMCQPAEDAGRWFNLMVLHQNRAAHGPKNHIPEHFLSASLDLVVWGHEHQCRIDPEFNAQQAFYVTQPGSSVATALSAGEAAAKHVGVLRISRRTFKLDKIRLRNVRPFVIEDVVLAAVPALTPQSSEDEVVDYLRRRVERMLVAAQQQYRQQLAESAADAIEPALGAQPKPLVRLRVEYSGGFESFHPQRFGLLFAGRVANPRDIVYFYRRPPPRAAPPSADTQGSTASTGSLPASARSAVPMPVDAVHVESLIGEFLDDSSMRLLVDLELAEAVRQFVQKGDADAIAHSLRSSVADTQRRVLADAAGAGAASEAALESRISLTRVARRLHAAESGFGLVDVRRSDAVVVAAVSGAEGATARRAAPINPADRAAIHAFERTAAALPGEDASREYDGSSSGGESDGDAELRRDLAPPAPVRRPRKAAPGAVLGKHGRRAAPPPTKARGRIEGNSQSGSGQDATSDWDDHVAGSADPPPSLITRPSRNARTTLASASPTPSPALPAAGAADENDDEDEEMSLPSSMAPPARKRGRLAASATRARGGGRGARGRATKATAAATQRQRSTATTPSSTSSQMPAITIDDDDDDDDNGAEGAFGRFTLRKRA